MKCCLSDLCSRIAVATLILWVLGGCAGSGGTPRPAVQGEPEPAAEAARPKVEVDGEFGITVTEVVRIGSDVREEYHQALILLGQERLAEGIELLEAVVEKAPEITAPHIDLGVAYARTGAYEDAERSLEAALALAPDHPAALNEIGIVQRKAGRFDAARMSYERALAVLPSYHYALRNLGVLCDLYLEDLECALASYEAYAEIVGEDQEVGIWIADLRNRLGLPQQEGGE